MKATEIIKKAQAECGEFATGYRADVNEDVLGKICEMMWAYSAELGYRIADWHCQMFDVLGKKAHKFWVANIFEFEHKMVEANKTVVHLGARYCQK